MNCSDNELDLIQQKYDTQMFIEVIDGLLILRYIVN